jgi:hypothetical protein
VPILLLLAAAWPAAAQESAPAVPVTDSVAQPAPKKKGMFGKLKSIAGNKTVQSVAKVAACTMVPGGQFVAAGIDAAGAAADKNAVGAAAGAAGAATGSACYGGMGGAGAGAAGAAGMGTVPGLAGTATSAAGAMTAMSAMSQMGAQPGTMAQPGELSAKDEKKMRSMLKKQGMSEEQINSTIAMYKQQSQPEPEPAAEGSRFGGQQNLPATAPGAPATSQPVGLPDDYDAQLKAGKLVLIDLPWKGSSAELIAGTEDGVKVSFLRIVESLSYTQGTWRVDVYVSELDKGVAQARATAVVVFLTSAGLPADEKLGGKATAMPKSKQPRVEIVRN